MRRKVVRAVIFVAAVAAAVILFVVFGGLGGTDEPAPGAGDAGPQTTQPDSTSTEPANTVTEVADPEQPARQTEEIRVRDGQPLGGVARLEYKRGERIRFTVFSDTADEVHVHGFDLAKDVEANGSVRFDFRADIEGVYEVELEGAHVQIAELRIEP
jgi:pullulanase/glycogen debranching enzyme